MAKILSKQTRSAGRYDFGPVAIPDGLTWVRIAFDRTSFNALPSNQEIVRVEFQFSVGGQVVDTRAFATMGGDVLHPRTGAPVTETAWIVPLPVGVSRVVSGTLVLAVDLSTDIDVTAG